jgi:uncharacterized protein (TIGR02266 family)
VRIVVERPIGCHDLLPWYTRRPVKKDVPNRRRAPRLYHELPVAYRSVGSFLSDWATNISRGGLFINTRDPLPVGSEVKLLIQLPGAAFPFDITGRVTRVADGDDGPPAARGMALEFTDLERSKRDELDRFVERLRRDLGAA